MKGSAVLFVGLVGLRQAFGFFEMFRPTVVSQEHHTVDTNLVRGVPEYLHGKYLADVFICDGKVRLGKDSINDNFCDCADGSDEPGTSACRTSTFHCVNKGFKMVVLPSSRVDDHICDCCDGSDEAEALCPNVCNAAAEREKAALASITAAYKKGSVIREELILSVKKEKTEQAGRTFPLSSEINNLEEEIASVKLNLGSRKADIEAAKQIRLQDISSKVDNLLELHLLTEENFSHILSNLFTILNLETHQITNLIPHHLRHNKRAGDDSTSTSQQNHHHHDDEGEGEHDDHVSGDEDVSPDGYGDEGEGHHTIDVDTPPVMAEEIDASHCPFSLHSNDLRLTPLCQAENIHKEASTILHTLLKEHDASHAFTLLTGFNKLTQKFEGSGEYVKNFLTSLSDGGAEGAKTCPSDFEPIKAHCSLSSQLSDAFEVYKEVHDETLDSDVAEGEALLTTLESKRRGVESDLKSAQTAEKDLELFKESLEYLALKDQCFSVVDGKFSYTLCVLGKVTQKEVDGHNTVTLGEFSTLETNPKDATTTMLFENGQHCHAHGARKADVKILCGPDHILKSANEPSTCHYNLVFESPAACSQQFAALNGIVV